MRRSILTLTCILLAGCPGWSQSETPEEREQESKSAEAESEHCVAVATLENTSGAEVGDVVIAGGPLGATLAARLRDLPPGEHGFHIHQTGECTPDFGAAGGHFNPTGKQHGFRNPEGAHAGDLPNLIVPASGAVSVEHFLPGVEVCGESGALFDDDGAAMMIHQNADDYESDPAGAAGDRIACGVLRR